MEITNDLPLNAKYLRPFAVADRLRVTVGRILLRLVVFEAAIFGSGRLLQIGPLTVKMALFGMALLVTFWSVATLTRLRYSTTLLTISYIALMLLGLVIGLCHGADSKNLAQDVSSLSSFLILPFFEITIRSKRDIEMVIGIVVAGALVLAAGYAVLLGCIATNVFPLAAVQSWIGAVGGEDFIFEGQHGALFYKGSLYLGIALLLIIFKKGFWARATALILLLSLFATGVRGFFLALAVCAAFYVFFGPIRAVKKIAIGLPLTLAFAVFLPLLFSLAGDKTVSNSDRITTISQVADRVTFANIAFGHGLGIGVPIRPVHMEMTYLEIFYKQGVVGLLWWSTLVGIAILRTMRAVRAGEGRLAYPLCLTLAFVCVESATNPFLNNPIGMYPFLICYVALGLLAVRAKSVAS